MNVKSLAQTQSGAVSERMLRTFGYGNDGLPSSARFRGILQRRAGRNPNFFITRAARFLLMPRASATLGEP